MRAEPAGKPLAGRSVDRWRAKAFGLDIDLSFEAPGLTPAAGDRWGSRTRIELVPEAEIDRDWPSEGVERVMEERFEEDADQAPARTIDAHPEAGYRLYARGFGLARISQAGDLITCAPPDGDAWSWQRFLIGRILPWTAVISGHEAFHASAVAIEGHAVAFVGASGLGKTSLALRLVAQGAGFLTDDVLVVDRHAGKVRAHPGAAIAAVRPDERAAIDRSVWDRLGTVLGDADKTYLALPRVDVPLPLSAICFLWRGEGPALEHIAKPDPRVLLASTFVFDLTTPARLRNQLDVCAAIARDVTLFKLRADAAADAGELAQTVAVGLASL